MTKTTQEYTTSSPFGLGTYKATIHIAIENIPPLPEYQNLSSVTPLNEGDISRIGQLTGNHWRKIFNVLAKLLFEYKEHHYKTWQVLRDEYLLQEHSKECLLFSGIRFNNSDFKNSQIQSSEKSNDKNIITLVMGKTYAKKLGIDQHCYWLSEHFAINTAKKIIICPYFDYRQLSNIKITQLAQLMKQLEA